MTFCRCPAFTFIKCIFLRIMFHSASLLTYNKDIVFALSTFPQRSYFPEAATEGFLRNFAKFIGKHPCQSLIYNIVAGLACNFIKKETLAQVFSCEFCEISKNTFFTEHFRATASNFPATQTQYSQVLKPFGFFLIYIFCISEKYCLSNLLSLVSSICYCITTFF